MKDNRKTELKVGITVIAAVLCFLLIFGWAKNLIVSGNRHEVTIKFNSVAGLEKGDPVAINGVRKGYVTEISVLNDSVIVKAELEQGTVLKADAKFFVAMLDLMGGKKIEVYPGSSETRIDFKKIQKGSFQGDIASAMAMLSSVQGDLIDVIKEIKITLTSMNSVVGDKEFTSNVKRTIKDLKTLTENVSAVISENREGIKKLLETGTRLAENADSFINDNKEEIKNTVKSANELIKNSNELIIKITNFSDEIKNKQNNAGKLLYDEQFMNDLKTSVKQAKDLLNTLIKQLEGKGLKVEADVSLF